MIILININFILLKNITVYHWLDYVCLSNFSDYADFIVFYTHITYCLFSLLLISSYFYTLYLSFPFNLSFTNYRIYSFSISSAYYNILVPSPSSIPYIYSTVSNSKNYFTTSTRYLSIAKCRGKTAGASFLNSNSS